MGWEWGDLDKRLGTRWSRPWDGHVIAMMAACWGWGQSQQDIVSNVDVALVQSCFPDDVSLVRSGVFDKRLE